MDLNGWNQAVAEFKLDCWALGTWRQDGASVAESGRVYDRMFRLSGGRIEGRGFWARMFRGSDGDRVSVVIEAVFCGVCLGWAAVCLLRLVWGV